MSNDPRLYEFLTSVWPMGFIDQSEWQKAVREACKYHEYWLDDLVKNVGPLVVAEAFEQIMLDWGIMKEKLVLCEKKVVFKPRSCGMTESVLSRVLAEEEDGKSNP